ncbi:MAG: DUF1848 domain-containing protein, partial [Clostridia bacterium]
ETIDCIVFWTKDPAPLFPYLDRLDAMGYSYCFAYTITAYGAEVEKHVPEKARAVDTFQALAARIGKVRVDWRFDPIWIRPGYDTAFHVERFAALCEALHGATTRCILSFADAYRHVRLEEASLDTMRAVAKGLAAAAAPYGLPLYTCAETADLQAFGIGHAHCIDPERIAHITGRTIAAGKDPGQRPACGCAQSVDIGAYDTCLHGCTYCYATRHAAAARRACDENAPMITGALPEDAQITTRGKGART